MTAGVVAATVVGNIVDNVNDNNNNNNNNNNQDNQNSNNMNINNNDNMNMNMNMLNMAMGRGLFEEWVREGTSKVVTKEMENAKKYNELGNERHDLSTHDGLTFFFKLVCKVLTSWMKVSLGPRESKPLRDVLLKKIHSFRHCPNEEGGGVLPNFFGTFSRSAFLVNKRSLHLPKCQ